MMKVGRGRGVLAPDAYLMKGRSSARNAFTYQVACTTSRARRFFRSLEEEMRSSCFLCCFLPEGQVALSSAL